METSKSGHRRAPLLQFSKVTKRFGGNVAVDRVSFDVEAGAVLALLGENGAGKSTLIKTLAGIHQRDEGEILFEGRPLTRQHLESGEIAFIHQDLGLVDWMTVAENMSMVMGYPRRFGVIDWRAAHRLAAEALALVGADIDPRRRVSSLSRSEQSLLAIARAVHGKARLLVLDEPTASLPAADVEQLFQVIGDLRRQGWA
ncbi:ATP-binding cassette domain-containing protein [Marinobacterium aestuariivivens]|uniref:ATP-binding cassette domain-containing protein n=1 Tax=Marinobacterium aestuariivivens TaxID=1698799 RepID=A0ABW2A5A1_9GAMM